jgi:putative nucleotidyltransferase with HDIG domain
MQMNIRHLVLTIANAVDLVGVTDVFHGRRVGMMAVECAKALQWDAPTQRMLFDAGLLHDCGVSSTREHHQIINELEWQDSHLHCEQGNSLLQDFAPLAHLAPIVRHHHTRWEDLTALQVEPTLARHANLIHLVDRVDALAIPFYRDESLLLHVSEIRDVIKRHRGQLFAPDLVDAFLAASTPEAFWLQLDPAYIPQYVADMERFRRGHVSSLAELKQFAVLIARIVDEKSHYTAEHSQGVARLARFLGQQAGIDGDHLDKLEIAALMHDIGKLQVPDELLESAGPFSPAERAVMKKHSFATYQILRRIGGFEELALWAAEHHESLNGSGYPFHLQASEIPLESRIIKVADIFQALAQRRPYRAPLPALEIMAVLHKMLADNEVDEAIVSMVDRHLDECQRAALGLGEFQTKL